ncbi:MAG: hypothetical protein IT376_16470 [Polyangiaceae bacterium]|nr:hypothetical protein [Polyangiaceae bacterium]
MVRAVACLTLAALGCAPRTQSRPVPPPIASAPAPAWRVVCTESARTLATYAPYLARTLAAAQFPGTLRVDASLEKFNTTLTANLPPASTPGERAVREAALDLLREIDALSADVTLGTGTVDLGVEIGLGAANSLLGTALASRVGDSSPPPVAFWKVPADATVVIAGRGAPPGAYRGKAAALVRAAWGDQYARHGAIADADADKLAAATFGVVLTGGPFLMASGADVDAALAAASDPRLSGEPQSRAIRSAYRRWTLLHLQEPIEHVAGAVSRLAAAAQATADSLHAARPAPGSAPRGHGAGSAPAREEPPVLGEWWFPRVVAADALPAGAFRVAYREVADPAY